MTLANGFRMSAVAVLVAASTTVAGSASAAPTCFGKPATIVGTAESDTIDGTPGRDIIVAGGGIDSVDGRGGSDLACLGGGADQWTSTPTANGKAGAKVQGGAGHDIMAGCSGLSCGGRDTFIGGGGRDALFGWTGVDRLLGGAGVDRLHTAYSDPSDTVNGGRGSDECATDDGDTRISCERSF